MTLRFAYDTSGAAHHRLDDAVRLIAAAGYDGLALTLDIHHLDPFAENWAAEAARVASLLQKLDMGCVVGTGAGFLLDPSARHEPTLVTPDAAGRARRIGFLRRAAEIGAILDAEAVSFSAGKPRAGVDHGEARRWLLEGLHAVSDFAQARGLTPCLEPRPGMLVETLADFAALDVPGLKLGFDTTLCLAAGEPQPGDAVRAFADQAGTVSIADMKRGSDVALPFGAGDMDIPAVLSALEEAGVQKLICVSLPHEGRRADTMIPEALAYLKSCRRPGPEIAPEQATRRQFP